jgi:hypothetical protein
VLAKTVSTEKAHVEKPENVLKGKSERSSGKNPRRRRNSSKISTHNSVAHSRIPEEIAHTRVTENNLTDTRRSEIRGQET